METILLSESEIKRIPNNMDLGIYVRQKLETHKTETYDKCVLCGKTSPYKTSTHIDCRLGYIEGAGQGCFRPKECHANSQPNNINI